MPPVNQVVAADCVLSRGLNTLLTVILADISEGDIFVATFSSLVSNGVVIATCLIRFWNGFANLPVTYTSPEQIMLHEGTTVATTHQGPTIDVVDSSAFRFFGHFHFINVRHNYSDVTPAEAESLLALMDKLRLSSHSFTNTLF